MTDAPNRGPVAIPTPARQSVWQLRLLIPAALLLFVVAVGAGAYLASVRFSDRAETQAAVVRLTRDATTLQRTLEYLFSKDALEEVQRELAERGTDPAIEAAVVIDDRTRVMAAANRALLGRDLNQRLDQLVTRPFGIDLAAALREAQARRTGRVLIGDHGNLIVAVYPVVLGAAPGQLGADRLGALIIARELASVKAHGRREMARLTGLVVVPMAIFLLLLVVGSHYFVTRRVTALVRAAGRFAAGDRSARAGLRGPDELAHIGRAFDAMAGEVAAGHRVLAESEERLRLAVNGTTDGIWDWNPLTHQAALSPRWKQILGYRPEELPDDESALFERVHPDDRAAVDAAVVRHLERGEPYAVELRLRHKDGAYRWALSRGEAVRDETGRAVRMLGSITDITARKVAEDALRESRRSFATLLDNLPGVVYRCRNDQDWTVEFMSDGALALTGYGASDFMEKKIAYGTIIHPDDREPVWNDVQAAIAERRPFELLYRICVASGEEKWVWERGRGIVTDAGALVCLEGFVTDITERKRAEEEILRFNDDLEQRVADRTAALEAANRELESFGYSVSHDLREPLRAIGGFSRALLADYADRLDDTGKDYLRRVHVASGRMAELIDALLTLARITRSELSKQPVDLADLARSIDAELRNADPTRNVAVTIHDALKAEGDPRLMRIALENLLGNAWKFTAKRSHAMIEFGRIECNGTPAYFVRDNGAGFDMAYSDKLFGAFQRFHGGDEFEGTGIGLATVQRIIHRHGGRIWAEAEAGKGATFYFAI